MATLNSHGLEPQEEAVMDLWDRALSVERIAAELGISIGRVAKITVTLADDCRSDRWALGARSATASLIQAIARAHPEMVTS